MMVRLTTALVAFLVSSAAGESSPVYVVQREWATYYLPDSAYAPEVDSALLRTARQLERSFGHRLSYAPKVHIVADSRRFDSLLGGGFPHWGAAAAIPHQRRIVVKSPHHFRVNRPLRQLLAHEYAHLWLSDRLGLGRAPRWLDEGIAMTVSLEWGWQENLTLNRAAVLGELVGLSEIERVNRLPATRARVAYAEAYLAVTYLLETYGRRPFNRLLDSLAAGASLDRALTGAIGADTAEFEAEFADYLRGRFNLVMLVADTMYFWIGLALLLVLAGLLRYARRRRYYERWREEERFQSTDFDYGDPDHPERLDDDEPWRG